MVEDDAIQRLKVVESLMDSGYAIDDVDNAGSAVEAIESGLDGSVVVTDVPMPGSINGFELAQTICGRCRR